MAEDGSSSGDGDDGELHCGVGEVGKVGWKSTKWVSRGSASGCLISVWKASGNARMLSIYSFLALRENSPAVSTSPTRTAFTMLQRHCRLECQPTSWAQATREVPGLQAADPSVYRAKSLPRAECPWVSACEHRAKGAVLT
jgi:hypothetical protein